MNITNFDQASSGNNIELNCSYDVNASQAYFEENFTLLSGNSSSLVYDRFRGINIYSYGLDIDLFDLKNWIIPTNKELLNKIRSNFYGSSSDLKDDCLEAFGKYPSKMNKSELLELVENLFSYDYQDFILNNFKFKHGIVSSRGYSQGDYVEVVYDKNVFKNEPDFDHELWDAPIYARLTVNGTEFYIDEHLEDSYNWDVTEIKKIIKDLINKSDLGSDNEKQAIYKEICEMIPSDLSYI